MVEVNMVKKVWAKPLLVVLGRGEAGEAVLTGCKVFCVIPTHQSTSGQHYDCIEYRDDDGLCYQCSGNSAS
jgi:hypothetical protein